MRRVWLAIALSMVGLSLCAAGPHRNREDRPDRAQLFGREQSAAAGAVRPLEGRKFSILAEPDAVKASGGAAVRSERKKAEHKSLGGKPMILFDNRKQTISVEPIFGPVNGGQLSLTF
jgi:hypothetical protein